MERKIRNRLDDWQFWMAFAYFALVIVVIALFYINVRTDRNIAKTARDEAIHSSEIATNAKNIVSSCLTSRLILTQVNSFLNGVKILNITSTKDSLSLLQATPKNDPLFKTRLSNYTRLRSTIPVVSSLHFKIPTKQECHLRGAQIIWRGGQTNG